MYRINILCKILLNIDVAHIYVCTVIYSQSQFVLDKTFGRQKLPKAILKLSSAKSHF